MPSPTTLLFDAGSLVLALILVAPVRGADAPWPQFRGPNANPTADHERLPERWSTTENVEWSTEVPGRGWSSPIVAGGKVFLTTATTDGKSKPPQIGTDYSNEYIAELIKQGLSEKEALDRVTERDIELPEEVTLHYYLYCFDIETGKALWKKQFHEGRPPGGRHRKNSFASETPTTDGELVYVYAANLGLYAYDLNGEQAWATPLKAYPIYLDFGNGASPTLHENQLLILSDNEEQQFLASFDKRTGRLLWRTERDLVPKDAPPQRSGWVTPFIWSNELRTEIVTVGPGAAVSYDLTGKELWRLAGMSAAPAPSPFAYGGLLFVDAGRGKALFAIRPGALGAIELGETGEPGEPSEHVAWSAARAGTYIPTPVAYDGRLYAQYDKGFLSRFNAETGARDYRARIDRDAAAFTSSPWAYNGKVFCLSEEGDTYVVAAGETFELLHVNPLGEMSLATPAIVGDRLLIRTESRLYSIRRAE